MEIFYSALIFVLIIALILSVIFGIYFIAMCFETRRKLNAVIDHLGFQIEEGQAIKLLKKKF